jgi:hypothetical protein
MQPIYTLNSRGDVTLGVMRDLLHLSSPRMRAEIQEMHQGVIDALHAKGIEYKQLRSALVPSADRNEAGFLFDSKAVDSSWYGREVMRHVLPMLEPRTTQSILCGDLLGDDQRLIFEILEESMVLYRSFTFRHATLLFCVYINNLSDAALRRLHERLGTFPAYLGYIPSNYSTRAKIYLSTCMANIFLKAGIKVIMGHEDDRPIEENVNLLHYPFEEFGYKVFSFPTTQFGIFLSFKIERPVFKGLEIDSEMSLNAISDDIRSLNDLTVVLDDAKHGYLINEKKGKMQKAGIDDLDRDRIASLIKSKIASNYIYNMVYAHDIMKFNLMIEVEREDGGYPTRLTITLEYRPKEKALRVITMH